MMKRLTLWAGYIGLSLICAKIVYSIYTEVGESFYIAYFGGAIAAGLLIIFYFEVFE
jgi:uncharacterized protein YybS (DUF2232 family)